MGTGRVAEQPAWFEPAGPKRRRQYKDNAQKHAMVMSAFALTAFPRERNFSLPVLLHR